MEQACQYIVMIIFCLAYCQGALRREHAIIFASIHLGFGILFMEFRGGDAYIISAFFDMLIVLTLYYGNVTKLSLDLQLVSIASILLNSYQRIMGPYSDERFFYDWSYIVLYMWAIYSLLDREGLADGNKGNYRLYNLLRLDTSKCYNYPRQNTGEV